MKTATRISIFAVLIVLLLSLTVAFVLTTNGTQSAYAAEEEAPAQTVAPQENTLGYKAIGAAAIVGLVATIGAIFMGLAIMKAIEGITRQPEADGKIRTTLMLGLVFIETTIIYALIIAILLVFVL